MGLGICAMHYSGMSAIQILPIITYEPWLFIASGVLPSSRRTLRCGCSRCFES